MITTVKISTFDAKTNASFIYEVTGPSYKQRIIGPGYFIIINPDSKYVSFSKCRHDICFGDVVSDLIHEYTNTQYANDYGKKIISYEVPADLERVASYDRPRRSAGNGCYYVVKTVLEYMQENCRMDIK